jgi:quercetin dioxygenase-like cupin family protein
MIRPVFFALGLLAAASVWPVAAAEPAYVPDRKILQESDVPGGNYVTVMTLTTIEPNKTVARHTHPGVELSYILEGEGVLTVEGKPQPVKAGMHFKVEANTRHSLKNGGAPMKIMAIYVIPKGAPLATPAPE